LVGITLYAIGIMLPRIDEETVEAAEGCEEQRREKEREPEAGLAGDCRDEGGGGEADAYSELFGESVRALSGVNEDEVSEDEDSEDEVEVDGFVREARKEDGEGDGTEKDSGEKGCAVAIVEAVAGFEGGVAGRLGVEDAIGCVERPDGDEHGERGGEGKVDVVGGGDEPGPERGYRGGVEGEEVPESERGVGFGGHLFILGVWVGWKNRAIARCWRSCVGRERVPFGLRSGQVLRSATDDETVRCFGRNDDSEELGRRTGKRQELTGERAYIPTLRKRREGWGTRSVEVGRMEGKSNCKAR
jgi:hypothetical protein